MSILEEKKKHLQSLVPHIAFIFLKVVYLIIHIYKLVSIMYDNK